MPTLKTEVEEYLAKYHLDSFGFTNWGVTITVVDISGKGDLLPRVEKAVRENGELAEGDKITEDTDVASLIKLHEVSIYEFQNFITVTMICVPCIGEFEKVVDQLNGASLMFRSKVFRESKILDTSVPHGYINGGIYVIERESTNEAVAVFLYGSD